MLHNTTKYERVKGMAQISRISLLGRAAAHGAGQRGYKASDKARVGGTGGPQKVAAG
jgi:hypothetical protein